MEALDIENGYLVNTIEGYNRFQTHVEAALVRRRADGTRICAYLSSRCRPESISHDVIFNPLLYTFGILHTDEGTFEIHTGSSQCSRNPFKPVTRYLKLSPAHTSRVQCPWVPVRELSFDDLLAELQSLDADRDNRLHMVVEWQAGGEHLALYTDCRYINFPNPEIDHAGLWRDKPGYPQHSHRYVQPICGPVPYYDRQGYHLGYVAAHVNQSGTRRVEVNLRDTISFFALRPPLSRFSAWLSATRIGRAFAVSEYCRVVPLPATCRFYRYGERRT